MPTCRCPVVFDPRVARGFISHLLGAISGPSIANRRRAIIDKGLLTTCLLDLRSSSVNAYPVLSEAIGLQDEPLRAIAASAIPIGASNR